MKFFKNFLKQRYHLHLFGGAASISFIYIFGIITQGLAYITGINEIGVYFESLRYWEFGLIGLVVSTIIGLFWEYYHYFNGNAIFDKWDVIFTSLGGFIMGNLIGLLLI